jgi:3' terminal RNA ribose 2'-O-methyltransferase Hen1
VLDLGCGEGKLLLRLRGDDRFAEVVGVDVSLRALEVAKRRLGLAEPPTSPSPTIALKHGSVVYLDRTLVGYDAATLVEVVEHLDPERLPDLERVVFGGLRPGTVVVTTPNADYNVRYDNLAAGRLRHRDHRFEWGRAAFAAWATGVAARNGYAVEVAPIGPRDDEVGAPSQMGVFRRCD